MNLDKLIKINKINNITHNGCSEKEEMINDMVNEYNAANNSIITRFDVLINSDSALDIYVNDNKEPIKGLHYIKKKQGATTIKEDAIQCLPNKIKQGDILRFKFNETELSYRNYMVLSRVEKKRGYDESIIMECNILLNWEGLSRPIPAVMNNSSYGAKGEVNSYEQMSEFDSRAVMYIQKNKDTNIIYNGMRFIFNNNENDIYVTTKVQGVFAEGYYNNIVKYCKRVQEDDLERNIAYNPRLKKVKEDNILEEIAIVGKEQIRIDTEETYAIENFNKEVLFVLDEETIESNYGEIVSQNGTQCIIRGKVANSWIGLECRDIDTNDLLSITTIFIKK